MAAYLSILLLTFFAILTPVNSNTVTFYNYGSTNLWAVFTPGCIPNSAGGVMWCYASYPDLFIPSNTPNNGNGLVQNLEDPTRGGWCGNFYTYEDGSSYLPVGVIGEVCFMDGQTTFYDVSSIVEDVAGRDQEDGVHFLFPKFGVDGNRVSGCTVFPCPYCYSANPAEPDGRDDSHTCPTADVDLITYVGLGSPSP